MKMLILAEKPSVAKEIRQVLKVANLPDDVDVDSFHGHLMKLAEPGYYDPKWQKWDLSTLPIMVDDFTYLEDDKASCQRLMQKIRQGKYDYLVNACDAGREGDLIFYSFYWAHNLKIPVLRFWASETTQKGLLAALQNLKPASQFSGYTNSAVFRSRFDWLLGMNFSRAASLKTGAQVNIGSVMTPTLAMVVEREKAIQNFVPTPFYEVTATFKTASGETYEGTYMVPPDFKGTRLKDKAEAEKVANTTKAAASGKIIGMQTKRVSTKAPTLYSLLELQKDAAKYHGFKADYTLDIAQALYEKRKLITYPRSESRFLPTNIVPEIMDHIKPMRKVPDISAYVFGLDPKEVAKVLSTSDYVDDAKLTDHHAIIPTDEEPDWAALSQDEKRIYLLICKRFLSLFMGPYVVDRSVILTDVAGQRFRSSGKIEVDKGFGKLYASNAKDVILPQVNKDDVVSIASSKLAEKQTTPPERYTVDGLLDAMAAAGNKLSDAALRKVMRDSAGLGTSATRAATIKKLEDLNMMKIQKKTYYPTDFGIQVIEMLNGHSVTSPALRAQWEKDFLEMEQTNKVPPDYQDKINSYIQQETMALIQNIKADLSAFKKGTVGKCPKCGKPVVKTKSFYLCAGYKKDCDFLIPPEVMGAPLTDSDVKLLLDGKPTPEKNLTAKSGNKMTSALILYEGRVRPAFAVQIDQKAKGALGQNKSLGKCPLCGSDVVESGRCFICTSRSTGCTFLISKQILGAPITASDAEKLLAGKKTGTKTFQWKNGKTGPARLRLNGAKVEFEF